jgi:hypothetical protein
LRKLAVMRRNRCNHDDETKIKSSRVKGSKTTQSRVVKPPSQG